MHVTMGSWLSRNNPFMSATETLLRQQSQIAEPFLPGFVPAALFPPSKDACSAF